MRGEATGDPQAVDGTLAGKAFALHAGGERDEPDGRTRVWLPLLDGTDRLGVMALTVDGMDDEVREHLRRLAVNMAHLFFSNGMYTDGPLPRPPPRELRLAAEMHGNTCRRS